MPCSSIELELPGLIIFNFTVAAIFLRAIQDNSLWFKGAGPGVTIFMQSYTHETPVKSSLSLLPVQ